MSGVSVGVEIANAPAARENNRVGEIAPCNFLSRFNGIIEFAAYPFVPIHPRIRHNNIVVPKDFIDLYFLLHENHMTLEKLRVLVE